MSSIDSNAIDAVTEGIDRVGILDSDVQICAACSKEGNSDDMNTCNKCQSVKYCNAACKKKHRKKHKKACEEHIRRAAELRDEKLFKDHPPKDECPICFLPMPNNVNQVSFKACCGKMICNGCIHAMKMSEGKDLCAFCRTPPAISQKEDIKRIKKLMKKGNGDAFNFLAFLYAHGRKGLSRDYQKSNELYLKAGELGCVEGYHNLGNSYYNGRGVVMDEKKAKHYYELAAMMGSVNARHNIGALEFEADDHRRAMKHFMIAARAGYELSLKNVNRGFMKGMVTKDECANTLRAYQKSQDEMKSKERDQAAATGWYING